MAGQSQRLRLADVRNVHRLVEEVADRGIDPAAWRAHMLTRLCALTGGRVGMTMHLRNAVPGRMPDLLDVFDVGFDGVRARGRFAEYARSDERAVDPGALALVAGHQRARFVTAARHEVIDAGEWYASPVVSEARRSADIDHFLVSTIRLDRPGHLTGLILYKDWGTPPFSPRDRRVVRLFHVELLRRIFPGTGTARTPPPPPTAGPVTTTTAAAAAVPHPNRLPPHLRRVLSRLLAGRSVKEAAADLDLSPHTVKGYAKELYARAGVTSRGELAAAYLNGPGGRPIFLPPHAEIAPAVA